MKIIACKFFHLLSSLAWHLLVSYDFACWQLIKCFYFWSEKNCFSQKKGWKWWKMCVIQSIDCAKVENFWSKKCSELINGLSTHSDKFPINRMEKAPNALKMTSISGLKQINVIDWISKFAKIGLLLNFSLNSLLLCLKYKCKKSTCCVPWWHRFGRTDVSPYLI